MNKFYIVQVRYMDDSIEYEVRANVDKTSSILLTTRSNLSSAREVVEMLNGRVEKNRVVVQ